MVVHDAVPDSAQDFSFTAGGGLSPASFSLDDDLDPTLTNTRTFNDVPVGSGYSIAETVPPAGTSTSASCDDGSPVSNIAVSAGETVTCSFTNHKRGQVVVVKDATPDDPQDFSFTAGGGLTPTSFSLDDDANGTLSNTRTFADVPAGNGYSVSRDGAERLGPDIGAPATTAARCRTSTSPRRDRHLHLRQPQARAASWS